MEPIWYLMLFCYLMLVIWCFFAIWCLLFVIYPTEGLFSSNKLVSRRFLNEVRLLRVLDRTRSFASRALNGRMGACFRPFHASFPTPFIAPIVVCLKRRKGNEAIFMIPERVSCFILSIGLPKVIISIRAFPGAATRVPRPSPAALKASLLEFVNPMYIL